MLRVAIIAGLVVTVAAGLTAVLATGGRGARVMEFASGVVSRLTAPGGPAARAAQFSREAMDSHFASVGLKIGAVHLQGASAAAQDEILQAVALKPGTPILTVDLNAVRTRVEKVGWVASARVIRLVPDTIVVAVVERPLMAVWQHAGRTFVVAYDGAIVGAVDPAAFPRLPLIVGEGANGAARELLTAVDNDPNLAGRVEALVRVDQRRWDIRLRDGGVVALPAENEAVALRTLDDLNRRGRILSLGLERIDLRDPEMVVVRQRGLPAPAPKTTTSGV